jgi:hypothetical protein
MKFKILKGTDLYYQLAAIQKKADQCVASSKKLAKSIGAINVETIRGRNIAGGIDAFEFPYGKEPDMLLWMRPDRHNNPRLFYPRYGKKYTMNQELHDKILALPVVTRDEYNDIIGFKSHFGGGLVHYVTYGLKIHKDFALVSISEGATYTPISKDMIEILESEYMLLEKKIKD